MIGLLVQGRVHLMGYNAEYRAMKLDQTSWTGHTQTALLYSSLLPTELWAVLCAVIHRSLSMQYRVWPWVGLGLPSSALLVCLETHNPQGF